MKKRNNIRHRNKPVFDALVWKWNAKKTGFPEAKKRKRSLTSGVMNALGAAVFVGVTSLSWAQESEPLRLPEVEVRGREESYKTEEPSSQKYTEPLRNVPQTFTIVPEAVFKEQGATSLRDVLRGVAGITFSAGEGGVPTGDNLTIRGFSARTDLFIDGVRDFGSYSRDPFNFEQVEVIKGPASNYSGRGSTGGSVNLVSKSPHLKPSYGTTLGLGTDEYKRVTLDLNQPITEGTSLRFNALFHDADTPGRDAVTEKRYGFAPSLAVGLGSPTQVILSYFYLTQENIPDNGLPWTQASNTDPRLATLPNQAPPVDFSNFYGIASRDYVKTRTHIATLKVDHEFDESMTLRNLFRYGKTDLDDVAVRPRFKNLTPSGGGAPTFGTTITREAATRDSEDGILSNQTDLTLRLKTGKVAHTVVTGIEYSRETFENFARTRPNGPDTDLFNPNPNDVPLTSVGTRANAPKTETEATTIALYVFDTLKLGEGWQVSGGLRWESFDVETTCERTKGTETNTNCIPPAGSNIQRLTAKDEVLSWRAGVVYEVAENGSVYAAVGTSFNPAGEGLSLRDAPTSTSSPNLDPEENQSYEVGTKWDLFKKKLALSLAFFRTEKTNARTEDPVNTTDIVVLEGKQRVDGLEIGAAGSITDAWKIFGGYAYLESEVVSSKNAAQVGNELARTPKQTLSVWTVYQFPWNLDVGVGAQFVDKQFSSDQISSRRGAPSYWLVDAMLAYPVRDNLTLRLNGFNLTDEKYLAKLGGGHVVPGAGPSATLTADIQF